MRETQERRLIAEFRRRQYPQRGGDPALTVSSSAALSIVPLYVGFTGLPVRFWLVHVLTLRNSKLLSVDVYADMTEALEAAGLSE